MILTSLKQEIYKQDANITIREVYTPTADKRSIATKEIYCNNVLKEKTTYTYDSYGNVTSEKRYLDNMTSYIETVYNYDDNLNRPNFNGAYLTKTSVAGVRNADGTLVAATPGEAAGTIATRMEYDLMGRLVKSTDARGLNTTYQYDALGKLTCMTNPDGSSITYDRNYTLNTLTVTDERGTATKYVYNGLGLETAVIDMVTNASLSTTTYDTLMRPASKSTYNANGLVNRTTYAYDWADRTTAVSVYGGSTGANLVYAETYAYDDAAENGQYQKVTKTVVGGPGNPSVVTTTYTDKVGNQVKTGFVKGGIEHYNTYTYDWLGNMTSYRSAGDAAKGLAQTARYTYDYAGRVLREYNALNQYAEHTYDALGRLVSSSDYSRAVSNQYYDALGRVVRETTPVTSTDKAETKYYYDQSGNVTTKKIKCSASGETAAYAQTDYEYSNRNHLTKVTSYNGDSRNYTQYFYDAGGNILRMYTGLSAPLTITGLDAVSGTDQSYAVTKYAYDRFGNMTCMTDALNQDETYTYDVLGNLLTKTDRRGYVTAYTYDAMNRVTQTETSLPLGEDSEILSYTYGATGVKTGEQSAEMAVSYVYDELGRLISETSSVSEKSYTYDLNGNRTNFTLTVGPDAPVVTSYTYDSLNRLATVTESGVTASYAYDTNGNRSSVEYGNGLREEYSYNAGNMLTGLTNKSAMGEVLSSYTYTYTLDGNQSTKTEPDGRTTTYHYDGLGRLESEEETLVGQLLHKAAYTYDDFGNRSSMTVTGLEAYSVAYAYDLNNRLLTETQSAGNESVTTSYSYDASGNQLTKTLSDTLAAGESMVYNGNGQLSAVTVGTETTSYSYWPSGLRLSKSTGDTANTFIWDGANLVYESGSGTKYIRGTSLIASLDDGTARYYLYNGHGDVVQLADSTGIVTKTYRYDAFGVERDPDEADANPFRYCGEYYDKETGTYYLRARNYAPGLGRFTSEDPVRNGLHWYTYCTNNPIMFVDPWGLYEVGLRAYSEERGAIVSWDGNTGYASVTYNGKTIRVKATSTNSRDGRIYVDNSLLDTKFDWNSSKDAPVTLAKKEKSDSLPLRGEPNSVGKLYNPDGSLKQERKYGPDGNPVRDRDYNHPGDMEFPHDHLWVDGVRQKDHIPVPESERDKGLQIVLGTIAVAGTGYIIYRVIRMIPSLFPPLWATIPANIVCP